MCPEIHSTQLNEGHGHHSPLPINPVSSLFQPNFTPTHRNHNKIITISPNMSSTNPVPADEVCRHLGIPQQQDGSPYQCQSNTHGGCPYAINENDQQAIKKYVNTLAMNADCQGEIMVIMDMLASSLFCGYHKNEAVERSESWKTLFNLKQENEPGEKKLTPVERYDGS